MGQRGIINVIVLILVFAGIGIGLYLVQNPQIFNPKASESVGAKCQAGNVAEFKACWTRATQQQLDSIEITNQIICKEATDCRTQFVDPTTGAITYKGFEMANTTRPLTIYGKPDSGAGFKRVTYSDYTVLFFINTADITIKNLTFDDTLSPCNPNAGACGSMIAFTPKSIRPVIDGITTLNARNLAVQFGGQEGTVKNSKFIGSWGYGVWMDRADLGGIDQSNFTGSKPLDPDKVSRFITIDNNLFVDTGTAGLGFSAIGTPQKFNWLTNNFFYHNHSSPAYTVCGAASNQTCAGGQLVIERNMHSVVEGNIVKDGNMDVYNNANPGAAKIYTTGIEFSDLLENILIRGNVITRNSSVAMFADYNGPAFMVKPETINITQNEISANGYNTETQTNQVMFAGANVNLNCFVEHCGTIKKAKIYAEPSVCEIPAGSDRCTVNIKWVSNDTNDVKVKIRSNPEFNYGVTLIGSREANFITPVGAHFDLYMEGALVDSVFVKAFTPHVPSPSLSPSPSPSPSPSVQGSGQITANPNPCVIPAGGTLCSSTITWTSQGIPNLQIKIKENGAVFAQSASGTAVAPWISEQGVTFEAYSGTSLLNSLVVKGISSSPSPSPSPSISPTPAGKMGDTDNDGDIDIFDYNTFLSDYVPQNLRSDIDKNGRVDIFDYNLILQNFGK